MHYVKYWPCHLLLESLRNFVLYFDLGGHFFEQNSKSDIFEVGYNRGLIVVEDLLGDNMNQQDIVLVELLPLGIVSVEHSVSEINLLFPSKAHEIAIFFDQHRVDLASFK